MSFLDTISKAHMLWRGKTLLLLIAEKMLENQNLQQFEAYTLYLILIKNLETLFLEHNKNGLKMKSSGRLYNNL